MDEITTQTVERIFANGIQVGVINFASELGIYDEKLSEKKAHKIYGKKQIEEWRHLRWIVAYPSGNKIRAKFYYLRSECETAKRMLDMQNLIPPTKIKQLMNYD